jgi:hypothetical protein
VQPTGAAQGAVVWQDAKGRKEAQEEKKAVAHAGENREENDGSGWMH